MKKTYGYWSPKLATYVVATYQQAAKASNGHVQVWDATKQMWRGCGLYEVPESAWRNVGKLARRVEKANASRGASNMENAYRIRIRQAASGKYMWSVWHGGMVIGCGFTYHSYAAQDEAQACIQAGSNSLYTDLQARLEKEALK